MKTFMTSSPRHSAIAVLLVVVLAGCGRDEKAALPKAPEPIAVTLAPVIWGSVNTTVEIVGTLFGDEQATISAKVAGRIEKIAADVGDRVRPGNVLAQIDRTDYELVVQQREMALRESLARLGLKEVPIGEFDISSVATVQRARYEAANANAKFERAQKLHAQKPPLISDQDYADIETARQVAQRSHDVALLEANSLLATARTRQSELAGARQRLADAAVRAPGNTPTTAPATAGLARYAVTQRLTTQGEYVREGDPLFRVIADDPVKFRASVPERYVAQVKTGQAVLCRVEGYDRTFEGRVSRVNPAINPNNRNFELEVLIHNDQRLLRPGAFVRGDLVIGQIEKVPFVPKHAIVSFAGVDRVFSVKDGKAVEHVVQVGNARQKQVAIASGLDNSSAVVVSGQEKLSNGVPVNVTNDAQAAAQK
jgi:RND family efflux transporter MFP subunit